MNNLRQILFFHRFLYDFLIASFSQENDWLSFVMKYRTHKMLFVPIGSKFDINGNQSRFILKKIINQSGVLINRLVVYLYKSWPIFFYSIKYRLGRELRKFQLELQTKKFAFRCRNVSRVHCRSWPLATYAARKTVGLKALFSVWTCKKLKRFQAICRAVEICHFLCTNLCLTHFHRQKCLPSRITRWGFKT